MHLDDKGRELLNLAQEDFPLEPEPYRKLGEIIGLNEEEVLSRLKRMRDEGIIRRLGAVFESRKLGYRGTLCAMHVPPDKVDEAAAVVNSFPGVTHNYLREHRLNMWFTILAADENELSSILRLIRERTGIEEIMELPAEEVFKIRVSFHM